MNTKRSSVYHELILIFVVIVLPFILLSSCLLFIGNRRQRQDVLDSAGLATQNVIQNLDSSIHDIYQANFSVLGQSNVLQLSNLNGVLSSYEKRNAVKTLREQLTGINTANSLTESIRIHFRDWGRVYNSAGYARGSFQTFDPRDYEALLENAHSNGGCYADSTGISILITDTLTSNSASILEVNLSVKNIRQTFENLCALEDDYYLLCVTDSTFYIKNLPDNLLSDSLLLLSAPPRQASTVTLDGKKYIAFYEELSSMNSKFLRLVSVHSLLAPLERLTLYTVIFFILIFAGCLTFFASTRRLIRQPLFQLINGFEEVEKGNFSIRIPYNSKNDFSYLYHGFNQMTENIERSIEQDYQNKILLQQAELKQLQAQINPHFLYNSFFMLQRTIKGGLLEEAEEISRLLGKYFQYVTRNAQELVPLADEYEHAKIYADIQGLRFDGRISIHMEELPASCRMLMVPKLILQPVLENSFQYGLGNKLNDGILHLYFQESDEAIRIFIDDNGENLPDEMLSSLKQRLASAGNGNNVEMTGILNISRRLTLFSHGKGTFSVDRSSMGGLSVCITLLKGEKYESLTDRR